MTDHDQHAEYVAIGRDRRADSVSEDDLIRVASNPVPSADTVVMDCVCGHAESDHFRGTGNCMVSTEAETWACGCHEYRAFHADCPYCARNESHQHVPCNSTCPFHGTQSDGQDAPVSDAGTMDP